MKNANNTSSKHHYIPEFYIKGFCNDGGTVYVYDKKIERISEKPRFPGSVFYEKNRNTIVTGGNADSSLEDEFFKHLDNDFAKTLITLRDLPNVDGLLTQEKALIMQSFYLNLFWRIPFSDTIFEDLFNRAVFTTNNGETILDVKSDSNFRKIRRSTFAYELIRKWVDSKPSEGIPATLFDRINPVFLISDNPIIFKNTPKTTDQLFTSEYFLPISSSRMYCTIKNQNLYFDDKMAMAYNVLQIVQAREYVCASSLETLKLFIEYCNLLKLRGRLSEQIEILFGRNNISALRGAPDPI